MNRRFLISALLMLVLIPASVFGLACEMTCGFGSMASHHPIPGRAFGNHSETAGMSSMGCHSMQHLHRAGLSRCASAEQSCGRGPCGESRQWITGKALSIDQPILSLLSPLDAAMTASGSATTPASSSAYSLSPPSAPVFTVLRI